MFRILTVEDSRFYRESFRGVLDDGKFSSLIVEEAENAREAMEKTDSFRPNLIFMDIRLPDGSGLELIRKIRVKHPDASVAVLTSHDGPEYREAALRYGASHFFTKGVVTREEIQGLVKSSLSQVN